MYLTAQHVAGFDESLPPRNLQFTMVGQMKEGAIVKGSELHTPRFVSPRLERQSPVTSLASITLRQPRQPGLVELSPHLLITCDIKHLLNETSPLRP